MSLVGSTAALFDLMGRVAIVTGATRGIGLAIATALGEAGARVVISSEDPAACQQVAADLNERGIQAAPIACDLADSDQIAALVDQTLASFGRLDVLVCNGGIEGPVGPISAASEASIDLTLRINLLSAIDLTSAAAPHIAAQGGGSMILVSSIAGVRGNAALGVYGVTKAALAQLARNLAVEWGPKGVRVNALSPGLIETAFAKPILSQPDYLARRLSLTPLRRPGRPEEIAAAALFLAAPGGGFVTGHNLIIDGGTVISDGN